MPRKKQIKFRLIREMPNVIEIHKTIFTNIKGNWSDYFTNSNPIILELGCGYGEYTNGLASSDKDNNYIGVDIKGERIWAGANFAHENKLTNVAFLQTEIYNLSNFFTTDEISEIWITFPDPQIEKPTKRLTCDTYLEIYRQVLKPNGIIHLKTDSDILMDYTLDVLMKNKIKSTIYTRDLYNSEFQQLHYGITTGFEKTYLSQNKTIKYLQFQIH